MDEALGTLFAMSVEDHNALMNGNIRLQRQVQELQRELHELRVNSTTQNIKLLTSISELDLLRQQNQYLKDEVTLLTQQLEESRLVVVKLREEQEQRQLQSDKMLRRVQNELRYTKYMNAIQDANAYLNLENVLPSPHRENLRSLHTDRIGSTHYMYNIGKDKDSADLINYKLFDLQRRLDAAPPHIQQTLFRVHGETVEQVNLELQKLNIPDTCVSLVTLYDIELLKDWWLDE